MTTAEYDHTLINDVARFVTNIRLKTNQLVINEKQQEQTALKEHLERLTKNKISTYYGDLNMTKQNSETEKQTAEKVQNYKIYIYQAPEVTTIMPKTGKNAGKEIDVLSVKALHRNYEIDETTGDFIKKDPTFITLKKYGDEKENVRQLASLIQPGMQLRVNGSLSSREYEFQDKETGEQRKQTAYDLTANSLMLDLSQKGITSIGFEHQKQNEQTVSQAQPQQSQVQSKADDTKDL